ncbi:Serine hydroxymethyltransferase, cytosolic, partial [Nowakowskiella sp. JEL0078]
MGLDLPSGGHLTHGYATAKKKVSSSAIYFESLPYQVDNKTGFIDYDKLEQSAALFRPKLIICGASAYARDWDYVRLRKIADSSGAYLLADIAHISGLVAAQEASNPFEYCDVVTTTTHKTLRGPRAGLIFFRRAPKGEKNSDLEERVNFAVFPSNQGGPHNNTIAGIAVALKQVASPEFKDYAKQVRSNAHTLANALKSKGYKIVTDGTENHLILWDLRPIGLTGSKMEKICDFVSITLNKNAVHGDVSALVPGGVRIGTPALTSRSFKESDFEKVASFLDRAAQVALKLQSTSGKLLKDFVIAAEKDQDVKILREEIEKFSRSFPMPGFDPKSIPDY